MLLAILKWHYCNYATLIPGSRNKRRHQYQLAGPSDMPLHIISNIAVLPSEEYRLSVQGTCSNLVNKPIFVIGSSSYWGYLVPCGGCPRKDPLAVGQFHHWPWRSGSVEAHRYPHCLPS